VVPLWNFCVVNFTSVIKNARIEYAVNMSYECYIDNTINTELFLVVAVIYKP
jgi:hypothetical protein